MQISDVAQISDIQSFIVQHSISKVSQCFKEYFENNQKSKMRLPSNGVKRYVTGVFMLI